MIHVEVTYVPIKVFVPYIGLASKPGCRLQVLGFGFRVWGLDNLSEEIGDTDIDPQIRLSGFSLILGPPKRYP